MKFRVLSRAAQAKRSFTNNPVANFKSPGSVRLSKIVSAIIMAFTLAFFGALTAQAATFTVTNTNNSGAGSLRQAILDADANPGLDLVSFNIPGGGVHTISVTSGLPSITDPVTIDGYTQPGSSANTLVAGDNAVLLIEID